VTDFVKESVTSDNKQACFHLHVIFICGFNQFLCENWKLYHYIDMIEVLHYVYNYFFSGNAYI
jgi:hypothetical protein